MPCDLFVAFIPLFYQVVCYLSSALSGKFTDRHKSRLHKGLRTSGGPRPLRLPMIGGGGGNRTLVLTSSHMGLS